MPKKFPIDRKTSVFNVYENVQSVRKTACLLKVSKSTVHRWLNASHKSVQKPRHQPKSLKILEFTRSCLESTPFNSCRMIKERVHKELNF